MTYLARVNLYPPYKRTCIPIEETDTSLTLDTEQCTTSQALCRKSNIDWTFFF